MTTEVDRKPTWQGSEKPKRRPPGRPKGTRITVKPLEQITALTGRLHLPAGILTYRDVAEELTKRAGKHVGLGTVHRFARDGVAPDDPVLRAVFGLPEMVKVPACPSCGIAHVRACPKARKVARPSKSVRRRRLWHSGLWRAACHDLARASRGRA